MNVFTRLLKPVLLPREMACGLVAQFRVAGYGLMR